jgi:hypothetical protein
MSRESVAALVDRYLNDPLFRGDFARDPEGATLAAGITLDEDEVEALRAAVWKQGDEPLEARVSKYSFGS